MLRLIKQLELRDSGGSPSKELWILVFGMGLFTLVEQWIDGWVIWYSVTRLAMPIRGQLSALVFEKSLRRKNVKAASKSEDEKPAAGAMKKGDQDAEDSAHESSVLKSRQAIVNLVGVNARRISDYALYQFWIVNSVGKLVIFSGFLIRLIGWVPFGADILAWALVLPVNAWVSKFYIKAEDVLMNRRDSKLSVVNKALLGMRQIKFSALEDQWKSKILGKSEAELRAIRRVFAADVVLDFCWIVSPILLAAASLALYAFVHGGLSPSVAFVSVGIFKSLESRSRPFPSSWPMHWIPWFRRGGSRRTSTGPR